MARDLMLKQGKKITDRVDVKLGMTKLDEDSPEYYGLASVVTDEMAELALAMKVRVPTTPAEMSKKTGKDPVYIEQLFDQMSMIGLLEYNWENADHHKQWTLPIFVSHQRSSTKSSTSIAKLIMMAYSMLILQR